MSSPALARPAVPLPGADSHRVQFYEDEGYLRTVVADFLGAGLTSGETLIVVATAAHRAAFRRGSSERGFDVDGASRGGQLTLLDAQETLAGFMVDGVPDRERFAAQRGRRDGQGASPAAARSGPTARWSTCSAARATSRPPCSSSSCGTTSAQIHAFSLLCAYVMGSFYKESHRAPFDGSAARTTMSARPRPSRRNADPRALLRQVSLLQQRARALEGEIEHRKRLEGQLREALAERVRAEEALRQHNDELAPAPSASARLRRDPRARAAQPAVGDNDDGQPARPARRLGEDRAAGRAHPEQRRTVWAG